MALPAMTAGLSPMMKQYTEIKRQNEDKLLFYRLGDFYELFFDDAVTASRELELVLTGRECGMSERAPMCGVPCHSYEGYVAKLVSRGYKVAICEQTEAPAQAKGIVRREIVRVVTPGTVTDSGMLSEEANNYICSLYLDGSGFGLSFADISTGTVHVTESAGGADAVMEELSRFEPREIICNEPAFLESRLAAYAGRVLGIELSMLYDAYFDLDLCKDMVSRQFDGAQLAGMWNFKKGRALYSLGALVRYLSETQFHGSSRLVALETYRCAQYLSIPAASRRSLELVAAMRSGERRGSLLWVLDRTRTAMGKRLMRSFLDKPLLDPADINRRLDSVGELHGDTVTLTRLRGELEGIHDIERLMTRITYRSATPRDLVSLAAAGAGISAVKGICGALSSPLAATLADSLDTLDDLKERIEAVIADEPPAQIKEGGFIRDGFDPEIDELRGLLGNSKSYLARMEGELRKKTGIKTLKIGYNRVFGYYIEVSRNSSANVPESFVRRQTLAGGERYINDELKQLEEKILSAGERLSMLERGRYDQLLDFVEGALKRVQATAAAIAHIDVLASFAFLARENGYCRPSVDSGDVISIRNGRHPVVETVMDGELFVPNDVSLDCGENLVNIITGPNMAGKSTYMRQTALIVIMAQMGCFVPAASARIGVVDAVFTRVGASDDLFAGDSTFMVEMKEVAGILSSATRRSLIILDEIGRGTSTYDGMSIAQAVIERICGSVGAKTMFATHYHELTGIEAELSGVRNYSVAVKRRGDDITFLRRIVRGPADDSYGIEVARLAGLPAETVGRARDILRSLESREPRAAPADPPPSSDTDDSVRAGRVMSALAAVQVEKLTPVEAMYKLDEIKRMAAREASGEPGGKG